MPRFDFGSPETKVYVLGLDKTQAALARHLAALKPGGSLGRAVQEMSIDAMNASRDLTHVWTGTLRASHVVTDLRWGGSVARGTVHIAPNRNPVHDIPADVYGITEHNRGGQHAFYQRVVSERGFGILQRGADIYKRGI